MEYSPWQEVATGVSRKMRAGGYNVVIASRPVVGSS